jgi:GntR family transcriptional repressor for pyruvate dehydrogenase complex
VAVREHRLQPGDQLPAERELAERFDVSRPTLREALTALELAGVVESRQGRGTTIVATSSHVAMWGVEVAPRQVFAARLALEPKLARLAAQNRTRRDISDLSERLHELETAFHSTRGSADLPAHRDLPVHRAIARAAHNPILERALEDALVHLASRLRTGREERALVAAPLSPARVSESRQVVRYIEERNADRAAAVWRRHLTSFRDELRRQTPDRSSTS